MDEQELIRLAQAGDERALTELYRRYAPIALKTGFLLVGDRALAEDLVQETFIQVIRKIHTLRDPSRFRPWLLQILANAAKTARHKALWRRWLSLDIHEHDKPDCATASAQEHLEEFEATWELRAGIKRLKPAHRAVVVLHYFNELPEQEIADVLKCPVGTVKSRLFYARRELQRGLSTPTRAYRQAVPQAVPSQVPQQKG